MLDAVAAFRKGAAIEIDAATQAGKTTLCMEAAVRFILPASWQGTHIGGLEGANTNSCPAYPVYLCHLLNRLRPPNHHTT